ncbi:MAG: branched-chain amino acid ABC transporter permease [Hoeflea sp.]|uniref:ABC transporter permease subunit n=1 Tax=Hoeflea sp. TaxID=1940281 RepID=UPI001DE71B8F|nr:branched-chain amino acid ABC transporter permease [Hoeflea sp.]MBU4531106.1 branched-chain amino acid ABC transporter permease [Alphaproteobacteria bacterium]MBU4542911.1 branched-chain amino acid ABC transporter permease [Alphaproteobacteria bacterium]MBU4549754.1 branched-chain amino acid ABC transporter permease [Alphaproteobacteria bacterium]MBV1725420.1 branched-chain amino acid ABC transporter permease [Hoeflea sp.]MBV1761862.1 branched-chain amino acid ABC transporter permease [Hoef
MALFQSIFAMLYQFGDTFAFLVISCAGLAVIFGMMGVINLAHGEFIMCGAYVTASAARAGMPLPMAILSGALVAGIVGMIVERLVIRHFYHRPLDSIIATWGISLIATQGVLIVLGSTMQGVGTPLGSVEVGIRSYSLYRLVLMACALGLLGGLYILFYHSRFGVIARATIQKPQMALALGVDTGRVYGLTFGLGAALAGLAGGLYAPTMTMVPTMGATFIVESFVTVVVGGADIFVGAAPAAAILALIKAGLTAWYGQLFGQIGLLITVILVIRILPGGLSGWIKGTTR